MTGKRAPRWDDNLAGRAKCIAETNDSPLRVLAGPGTGKTFALMRRVARLLQEGERPDAILVATFTRTAARDLQNDLKRLGVDGAEKVQAGTLHAYCFGLLSREDVLQFTGRVPRPLLTFEERFLLQDLSGDGMGGVRDCRKRLRAFNAAWARLQSDQPGWPQDSMDQAFQTELAPWLRFHQAMLIGELVPETLRYLRDNPASPYRGRFKHVLVDEYQDLNKAEQELLDHLSEGANLVVIGDENQSIYSFKFAHPEGIATFDKAHPGTHDETLAECRRCPTRVIEMANALIGNNRARAQRPLVAAKDSPQGEVLILQWRSIQEEARGIAELMRARIADASSRKSGRSHSGNSGRFPEGGS